MTCHSLLAFEFALGHRHHGSAIVMMIIGMIVIWGGLILSIANLFRKKKI